MDKVYNRQKIENNKICAPYYINIPDTNGFSNGDEIVKSGDSIDIVSEYKFDAVNPNDPTLEENFEDMISDAIKEIRTKSSLKSSSLTSLKRVIETIDKKDKQYKRDPIDVLSVDDLTTQIKIKAIRACLTSDNIKKEDELLDIAVYSILTLEKMIKERGG